MIMQTILLLQHAKEEAMEYIIDLIQVAAGFALFWMTGVMIAKTIMFFNPDPEEAPCDPGVSE